MSKLARHLSFSGRAILAGLLTTSVGTTATFASSLARAPHAPTPPHTQNPHVDSDRSQDDLQTSQSNRHLQLSGSPFEALPTVIAQQLPNASPEALQLSISRDYPGPQDNSSDGSSALNLNLSTAANQLWTEDDILLDLVAGDRGGIPTRPTLIAATQGLMPLYLRSVRNVEEDRLGIRSVRSRISNESASLNQFLERFSNRYHCNLAWQSPIGRPLQGVELEHHLAIQRTVFGSSSLCQPLSPAEQVSVLTKLTFLPLEVGDIARLEWGSINYQVLRDGDGNVSGSVMVSPSLAIEPIEGLHLEVKHNLRFASDSEDPRSWFAAAQSNHTGAIVSVQLPEIAGNEISLLAESGYDWVQEEWQSSYVSVVWDIVPLGVQWEASTEYSPSESELHPITLSFQHELPWDIRWGLSTRYHQNIGELEPLELSLDHDLPLMEWLTQRKDDEEVAQPSLGLRYGVQTRQTERHDIAYSVGVGLEIGEQSTGQWDFRVDWDGASIGSLSTSYDRQDLRMLVRVEPDPSDYAVEGRLTLFSGN